jgi:hypothetical protein
MPEAGPTLAEVKAELRTRARARDRQRRSRIRRRQGLRVLRIVQDEYRLIQALQRAGRLSADEGLDWARVEHEAEQVLDDFIERWSRVASSSDA